MHPLIEKLTAVGLILALGMAPLQGLMAAALMPSGLGVDIQSIAFDQDGDMPAETLSHDCYGQFEEQDAQCCEQACAYGHCGVCFIALNNIFSGLVIAIPEPEPTHLLSDSVNRLAYPSFRPPRL